MLNVKFFLFLLTLILLNVVKCKYVYETKLFQVPLDHFGYQRNETFNIRYLVNEDNWDRGGGPIFFYTGNEGQIETFAQHTGFMWDIAADYRAKLVFAEHRYYGKSMPFGDKSLNKEHIGYLTSSQALADYADLVNFLQGDRMRPRYPVIAFGGSYGGMLSAYFRMKYPHLVTGAIAASAPVHMYPDMVPCEVFHRIVTSSFKIASQKCVDNIKSSWSELRTFLGSQNNSDWIKTKWNLCEPVKNATDVQNLLDYLQTMYETLAMVNYPFQSDFLMPLPAQPVRVVCQYLTDKFNGTQLFEAIGKVIEVYANYNRKPDCVNYTNTNYGNLDASGWDYQACTEMIMPMCTTGKDDMFEPSPWNFTTYAEGCHKKYGVYPRRDDARIQYGGDRIKAASNIVFSNGLLDPWAGGGILNSISSTVTAVVIIDAAHHLDLMPANPNDPEPVKMARNIHRQNIDKWLREFREEQTKRP
ncbi:lysosomal Pro-X carboxypeptidase [Bicyclus anynana]|uniref:Lysosomal Pro-X carboxypeptidase n=1 Tax=Bicyclus anynana TaxID=110368 RepID=A0ABM3LFZ9_BICAN|nr:lysosomal Pro-X carboxypeptidase [Bicyclus anynana]